MAISEVVRNAIQLAVEQINAAGGVLGKQVKIVGEDGASEPTVFEKAEKLHQQHQAAAVFGGWTSSSRKAMLPVFEKKHALLYYPVQYEGPSREEHLLHRRNDQPADRALRARPRLKEKGVKSLYLVGSDYVFPQTANRIIRAYAEATTASPTRVSDHTLLGSTDFTTIVNKVHRGCRCGLQHAER